jgi:regulator of sigma D
VASLSLEQIRFLHDMEENVDAEIRMVRTWLSDNKKTLLDYLKVSGCKAAVCTHGPDSAPPRS